MSSIHSIITRLKQLKRKADTVSSSATEVVKELDIILRDSELLAKGAISSTIVPVPVQSTNSCKGTANTNKNYWAQKLEGTSTSSTSNPPSNAVIDCTTSEVETKKVKESIVFVIGILLESDAKICFESKDVVNLQVMNHYLTACIPLRQSLITTVI